MENERNSDDDDQSFYFVLEEQTFVMQACNKP